MGIGKGAYLKKITSGVQQWRTLELGERLDGASPPSVFIGRYGYPKVQIGPMMAPYREEVGVLDTPEDWIPGGKSQEDIIRFRMDLVRGKRLVGIHDLGDKLVTKMQEISLAQKPVQSEAEFKGKPRGFAFDSEHQPHGPSAELRNFEIDNARWDHHMEKTYYDTDLLARDAVVGLYQDGLKVSQLMKALSTGTMGSGKRRKLVPTRWSITAVDSMLADHLYDEVIHFETIDKYEVREFESLNNYYAVILIPSAWQYEWIEAFIHIMGKEEMVFADHEGARSKSEYSCVGGCYYSCKMALLEHLHHRRRQAGAVVLREAYEGYVPLGVFNVRENVRNALLQKPKEFDSFRSALGYVSTKLRLPMSRFVEEGALLRDLLRYRQTTL